MTQQKKPKPLTNAERQAAMRQRQAELGRVAVIVYVDPDDREALRGYVDRLNKRRTATT